MWYELWDSVLDVFLDEGDDPARILEFLLELLPEMEFEEVLGLMLVERHRALQAETFFFGLEVEPHLAKRAEARRLRAQKAADSQPS